MTATVTPIRPDQPTADQALRDASPEALVDAVIRLTHMTRHHAAAVRDADDPRRGELHASLLADYRHQRDLVRAELITRATR